MDFDEGIKIELWNRKFCNIDSLAAHFMIIECIDYNLPII